VVGSTPPQVLERARRTVRELERGGLAYRIRLHRADAERLPYDDASFDTVVAFLTLCTVPDHAAAAAEAYRVLKPTGRLLVMEHVGAEDGSALAWWQRRLNPIWTRAAVGCHLDRDTGAVLGRRVHRPTGALPGRRVLPAHRAPDPGGAAEGVAGEPRLPAG
jgi:SAM-dependent methyltransferase